MIRSLLLVLLMSIPSFSKAQKDSLQRLDFTGDFRFRLEQDWDSRKSDGTFRDDRSRMRYRVRAGLNYQHNSWASVGIRVRTGQANKQQDPQLTLGDGEKEFSTVPIGFEKLYFQASNNGWKLWLGKNTFPFQKNNEQFWSDNVYPEGIYAARQFDLNGSINSIGLSWGHFIMDANGKGLNEDGLMDGFQLKATMLDKRLNIFPSFYYFDNIPYVPDQDDTHFLNYQILHFGGNLLIAQAPNLTWTFDYYVNLQDYQDNDSIPSNLRNETIGWVTGLKFGQLKKKKDWFFSATYNYQQRLSAIDYFSQNDWARWDYSSFNSPDGRLTNYQGIELVAAYAIDKNLVLKAKYYNVKQLVALGSHKENGSRVRFDLDIKF